MSMKIIRNCLLIQLLWLAVVRQVAGQGNVFLRISGPTITAILSFGAEGTLVWSDAVPGETYTVQMATSLPGGSNWVDYNRISARNNINTNVIFGFNAPAGMAVICAGAFTIGDTLDGELDAVPTNVTLSSFYMDANLVNYSQWQSVYDYASNRGYGFTHSGNGKAGSQPVQTVDWYDCVKWCNARSQ
jgi:formylglycine-generating enzyme required for sulfatase activity